MPRIARARIRLNRLITAVGFPRDWFLLPLAAAIGALGGVVATAFDGLVHASGEFFFGRLGGREFPHSQWLLLMFLPALGGLLVGLIQQVLARTGPSPGVPEVIESVARRKGELPARSGLYKAVTASLTIGSGGSAGVEGPIIHIGSVLGSTVGRVLRVGRQHMHTLVGCGAAAGMAGIFNTPIAGVMFVLEVLLRDFSVKTFIPIVVASVFGTAVAQAMLQHHGGVFMLPGTMQDYEFALSELWAYALLGVLCGLLGVAFSLLLRTSEQAFALVPGPRFAMPALGGLLLGVMGIVFVLAGLQIVPHYEPPAFFAGGYPVIEGLLNPRSYPDATDAALIEGMTDVGRALPVASVSVLVLLTVLAFKLVGTCLTLGSGGAGGVFGPSLFMGATLGATFGLVLEWMNIFPGATPATYALAGMAGVLAATIHAPLTAFLLVFELTQDYRLILPMMLVSIFAVTTSQLIVRDSIYARWLRRRGIRIGTYSDQTLLRRITAAQVPWMPAVVVSPGDPVQRLVTLIEQYAAADYVVCDENDEYVGMVVGEDLRMTLVQREAIPLMIVGELMRTNLPTVARDEPLDMVLDKFSRHDVSSLPVVDENLKVKGVITRSRLMRQYQRALEEA
ncbi:chloride channel protein [Phycisphaerales bacterium AB-hyl4]|uniref:Chloride channel protein n=1 Tax=Natronomicrosphaera hydrolytica TaxID=3242702 RepID=A0ABV4U1F0_9BACT